MAFFGRKPDSDFPLADTQAFAHFYEQTHLIVFRYLFGLTGGPQEEVEDLAGDTYIRAWNARRRFQGDSDGALGWLLRIAKNLVIDSKRRAKSRPAKIPLEAIYLPETAPGPEAQLQDKEQVALLFELLEELPPEHREMVVLRYFLNWRVREIARHINRPENTVSVTLRRILNRLQARWKAAQPGAQEEN
jgi:RNA polymerase sigma-70 factor (ECF subfamily)